MADHARELADLQAEVVRLRGERDAAEQHKQVLGHALDCVDRVFQAENGKPPPILPDFCQLGESKFAACVRLAEAYRDLQAQLTGRDMPTSPPTETPAAPAVRCFTDGDCLWVWLAASGSVWAIIPKSGADKWELMVHLNLADLLDGDDDGDTGEIAFPAALTLLADRPEQANRLKEMAGGSNG